MKLETRRYLATAHTFLANPETMVETGWADEAGRAAYYAAFHAAQALIYQSTGKVVKTHNGLHGSFSRIVKDLPGFDPGMGRFVSRSYNFKTIADYGTDPDITVSREAAMRVIQSATAFVADIEAFLTASPPNPSE